MARSWSYPKSLFAPVLPCEDEIRHGTWYLTTKEQPREGHKTERRCNGGPNRLHEARSTYNGGDLASADAMKEETLCVECSNNRNNQA